MKRTDVQVCEFFTLQNEYGTTCLRRFQSGRWEEWVPELKGWTPVVEEDLVNILEQNRDLYTDKGGDHVNHSSH